MFSSTACRRIAETLFALMLLYPCLEIRPQTSADGGATTPVKLASSWGNRQQDYDDAKQIDLDQVAQLIVKKTNQFRAEHALEHVKVNESLKACAQTFADYMADTDKYGHNADGKTPAERVQAAGYDFCMVRENIAYRQDPSDFDVEQLAQWYTQGWIDSPGHRENMLAEYATETGVAVASNDGVTFFAVQLFARPQHLMLEINIFNDTQQTVTISMVSNGGSDEFELPVGGELRSKRCFPTQLSIEGSPTSQKYSDSANVAIQSDNGELRIVKR